MINMVRDGRKVWPTCPECGCRLDIVHLYPTEFVQLAHYGLSLERDARGCECDYLMANWNITINDIDHLLGV